MKPSLSRVIVIGAILALNACSPSPYYTGAKSGVAPGAVPRDGMGRPILDGKSVEYRLPPPAPPLTRDIAGRPVVTAPANRIIYYEDLHYADQPAGLAASSPAQRSFQP